MKLTLEGLLLWHDKYEHQVSLSNVYMSVCMCEMLLILIAIINRESRSVQTQQSSNEESLKTLIRTNLHSMSFLMKIIPLGADRKYQEIMFHSPLNDFVAVKIIF